MHIFDEKNKIIRQDFSVPDHVTDNLKYSNLEEHQKINVIKYMFSLSHGKGKRKKKK